MKVDTVMQDAFDEMCSIAQSNLPAGVRVAVRFEYMLQGGFVPQTTTAILERYKDVPDPNPR